MQLAVGLKDGSVYNGLYTMDIAAICLDYLSEFNIESDKVLIDLQCALDCISTGKDIDPFDAIHDIMQALEKYEKGFRNAP